MGYIEDAENLRDLDPERVRSMKIVAGLLKPIFEHSFPMKNESNHTKKDDQKVKDNKPVIERVRMLKNKTKLLKEKHKIVNFRRDYPSDIQEYKKIMETNEFSAGILIPIVTFIVSFQ